MIKTVHQYIKAFVEQNQICSTKTLITSSTNEHLSTLSMSERVLYNLSMKPSLDSVSEEHIRAFKPTLNAISKGEFELKNHTLNESYKKTISTLLSDNNKDRYELLLETEPALAYLTDYLKNNHIIKLVENYTPRIEGLERLERLPVFSKTVQEFTRNSVDINALASFVKDRPDRLTYYLQTSLNFTNDITESPYYDEFLSRLLVMVDPLSLDQFAAYQNFILTNPKLSLLILQPYMVSVLGNALFLKTLLPLLNAKYQILYPNWIKVNEDLSKKFKQKKIARRVGRFLYNNKDIIIKLSTAVFPITKTLHYYLNKETPLPQIQDEEKTRKTFKETIESAPQSRGLETYNDNLNLAPARDLVSAIGTEIGRMGNAFTTGILNGAFDRNRPAIERVAESLDNYIETRENQRNSN